MPQVQHPANVITLVRAVLAVVVAVIGPTGLGLAVVVVALSLDWVDGQVARRTGTTSAFGARFDMETDAFLILVLSAYAAPSYGWWVLLIGAARYLLWLAERVLPWLRRPVPPRYWRKVGRGDPGHRAGGRGLGPAPAGVGARRSCWERSASWPSRSGATCGGCGAPGPGAAVPRGRRCHPGRRSSWSGSPWCCRTTPATWRRLPVEALLLVAVALLPWRRARRLRRRCSGRLLAVVVVVKVFDAGFDTVLDRPFDPVVDWAYLGPGCRRARRLDRRRPRAGDRRPGRVVVARPGGPAAARDRAGRADDRPAPPPGPRCRGRARTRARSRRSAPPSGAGVAYDQVRQVRADLADRRTFADEIAADPYADASPHRLLGGLRGKDVLVVFVESYGRVALEDTSFAPGVVTVLDEGTRRLGTAGWSSRSAFLTSPTFGAGSWLAHSTLQSGLWVDSQRRYDQLLGADRLTLTSAFSAAGWRTVFDVPADTRDWPEGRSFYGFDHGYDSRNVGYRGPQFGYAPMPDQYTLAEFQRLELDPRDRAPVMAEIDLVSSHHPWAPSPAPVPWDEVGDGSVLAAPPAHDDPDVPTLYGRSVEYTMSTLVSWLESNPDPDLVLLVLGDHQPHSYVTGPDPGHDVPVSVIARDPEVIRRIAGWGWQPGLHPSPDAPVWRMDAVRDRFLEAFSR